MIVTLPPRCTERELRESIERMRPKLLKLWEKAAKSPAQQPALRHIDWNFQLESEDITIDLQPDATLRDGKFRLTKDRGHVTLVGPADYDFDGEGVQAWLEKVITEQIRSYARGILPARLRELSAQYNLPFGSVSVNAARGRWGSCGIHLQRGETLVDHTSPYVIHLSLFTLLLPHHLQRFILLHELTHTLEMNHSPRFHAKLDNMLGGTEKDCIREMRHYTTSIFHFVGAETGAGESSEDDF